MAAEQGVLADDVALYPSVTSPPQDYDAALVAVPRHTLALFRKGQALAAQKKLEVRCHSGTVKE